MSNPDASINPRLLASAKKEFLTKGFEKASTNVICKNAGVTTGALFKRFASKEDLFSALVSNVASEINDILHNQNKEFDVLPKEEREKQAFTFGHDSFDFVEYIYAHFDEFKLLITFSKGTAYESFLEEIAEFITETSIKQFEAMEHEAIILGEKASPEIIHILVSSYLSGLFEPVRHDMEKEKAKLYIKQLEYFFMLGWADILKLKS